MAGIGSSAVKIVVLADQSIIGRIAKLELLPGVWREMVSLHPNRDSSWMKLKNSRHKENGRAKKPIHHRPGIFNILHHVILDEYSGPNYSRYHQQCFM